MSASSCQRFIGVAPLSSRGDPLDGGRKWNRLVQSVERNTGRWQSGGLTITKTVTNTSRSKGQLESVFARSGLKGGYRRRLFPNWRRFQRQTLASLNPDMLM